MTTPFDEATTAAIAAFAQLDLYTALQTMRAEADYDHERDQWISRYIDEHGGGADDAEYDALHARAQATPEYAQFIDAARREILEYFGVTDDQLTGWSCCATTTAMSFGRKSTGSGARWEPVRCAEISDRCLPLGRKS